MPEYVIVLYMKTSELDYKLPPELIAQHPSEKRDESRLLVLDRESGSMRIDVYKNIASYLRMGDCMVVNDTKVIRARLKGQKATGGKVEVFLLHEIESGHWEALVRPSARVKPGTIVYITEDIAVAVKDVLPNGRRIVSFDRQDVFRLLEEAGEIPLPPYIERDHPDASDMRRYQTVYASTPGAVAAPTAGLHFTNEVFESLDKAGISRAKLTLHVGYGTFRPIMVEELEDHELDPEEFEFPQETADILNKTRDDGGRIIAVGTTATRVLETQCSVGRFQHGSGHTRHYIYPPYTFKGVDCLQTNFHLPKSSLLALVFAFAGVELVRQAYALAIEERFRFYSYGDVMLII